MCNILLAAGVEQSDSIIRIHVQHMYIYMCIYVYIFFFRFFSIKGYYKILHIGPCWLSILCTVMCIF